MVCFPVLEKRHLIGVFHALQGKVNLVPITEIGLNQKSSFLVIRKVNVAEKLYITGRKELWYLNVIITDETRTDTYCLVR